MNINNPRERYLNATSYILHSFLSSKKDFTFDMGRSSYGSSIHSFKQQWGGRSIESYTLTTENIHSADPDQSHYQLVSKIWKTLPLSIAKQLSSPVLKGVAI